MRPVSLKRGRREVLVRQRAPWAGRVRMWVPLPLLVTVFLPFKNMIDHHRMDWLCRTAKVLAEVALNMSRQPNRLVHQFCVLRQMVMLQTPYRTDPCNLDQCGNKFFPLI